MNGYIKNKSVYWRHALKRSIGPGHEVPLDELFDQYGVKHDIEVGKPFVDWLRNVKLKDENVWGIVYIEDKDIEKNEDVQDEKKEPVDNGKSPISVRNKDVESKSKVNVDSGPSLPAFVKKEITPNNIANFTVREARTELKKITDIKKVKYAYEIARQLSNKDSLCNMLRRRIQELELTRR